MVAHTSNSRTSEVDQEDHESKELLGERKAKANLGCMKRLSQNKQNKKTRSRFAMRVWEAVLAGILTISGRQGGTYV